MNIKILGSGCAKCVQLESMTREVLTDLGRGDVAVTKVAALQDIMKYGILSTPGFVVDESVLFSGRVPTKDVLRTIIEEQLAAG